MKNVSKDTLLEFRAMTFRIFERVVSCYTNNDLTDYDLLHIRDDLKILEEMYEQKCKKT